MRFCILLFYGFSVLTANSQNLVLNGSFEDLNEYNIPIEWQPISPTVDVLVGGKKVFEKALASEYDKLYSKYMPKIGSDGNTYICLYKHGIGTEAISSKLKTQLQKGVKYVISIDVFKPLIPAKFPAFEMGIALSAKQDARCGKQQCLLNPSGNIVEVRSLSEPILFENQWINLQGEYMAKGDENYLTLSHPTSINRPLVKGSNVISYLIDNVIIKKADSNNNIELEYGISRDSLTLEHKKVIHSLEKEDCDTIIIIGKASPIGGKDTNRILSLKRAMNVETFVKKKFPDSVISTSAIGDDNGYGTQSVVLQCKNSIFEKNLLRNPDTLYSILKSIHAKYYLDQVEVKKIGTSKFDVLAYIEHTKRVDSFLIELMKFGVLTEFKIDVKSEQKLIGMILHGSDDFQIKYYPILKEAFEKDLLDEINYAYIVDRYRFILGHPQIYGTQLIKKNRRMILYNTENLDSLDERRINIGLPTIHDYLKNINK